MNFSSNYSPAENAIARAYLKMNEESLVWVYALSTWVYHSSPKDIGFPWVVCQIVKYIVFRRGKQVGYGLHTPEECNSALPFYV